MQATPTSTAPPSPTKSMTASAPLPSVRSCTAATVSSFATTVWSAPRSLAKASASELRSTTIISTDESARSTWTPMCPRPPAPMTTARSPGRKRRAAFATAWYAVSPASARAATPADRHVGDGAAHCRHPAGVLVAERVRQWHAGLVGPLAFDDVQVGPAYAGATDLHDDVERRRDLRIRHVDEFGRDLVLRKLHGLHRGSSSVNCRGRCAAADSG